MSYSSPLKWPSDVPRNKGKHQHGPFKVGYDATLLDLQDEIRKLAATSVLVTSDAPLRRDGKPDGHALASGLRNPGVSIFMRRKERDLVFALDLYSSPLANLRALTLALDGIRTVERYGGAGMEDRALAGFAALPAQAGTTVTHWSVVLGLVAEHERRFAHTSTDVAGSKRVLLEKAEARYKELAREHHSDVAGGSHEAMVELNRARDEARKELTS